MHNRRCPDWPEAGRVLVVGTTPDYVELMRREHSGRCLFLTESQSRSQATEPQPAGSEEVLFDWDKPHLAFESLRQHQIQYGVAILGIACFDCESMPLASELAIQFNLPYPSPNAIRVCRNKREMKHRWMATGTPTSRFQWATRPQDAIAFFRQIGGPCVLKPASGSGSELVFFAETEEDCGLAFEKVVTGLGERCEAPLYQSCTGEPQGVLVEEQIEGDEFSCDFLVTDGCVQIVRLTRKYRRRPEPFGIIAAYELSPDRPAACRDAHLAPLLLRAAESLGIRHAICMADFIVRGDQPVFLEVTPRCGGDCLPSLLKTACDFDVLGLAIRFARQGGDDQVAREIPEPTVALRLFADRAGRLEQMDATALVNDRRVLSVALQRQPGDHVRLPPIDYDSWILGHVIYRPDRGLDIYEQNDDLSSRFQMRIAE